MTQSMTPHRQWWKHPYTWVAIVVVIVLVTVVLAATLGHRSQSGTPSATQPSTATAVPSTSLPSGSDGTYAGSGLDSLGHGYRIPVNAAGHALPQSARPSSSTLTSPLAAPQGLEWQRVYGAPVPFSTSDGPREVHSDGTVSGFSHTPQGAALAAWQIGQRATWAPDDQNVALLDRVAVVSEAAELADLVEPELAERGWPVFRISAVAHQGLKELTDALATAFPQGIDMTDVPMNAEVASDGTRREG